MKSKWKWLSILFALMLTLMACQQTDNSQQGAPNNPNIDPTTQRNTGDGMTGNQNQERGNQNQRGAGNLNEQSRYEVANEAADRITDEVDEIERAYVLTTQNNAYVAAHLDADNGLQDGSENNRTNENRSNQDDGEELTDEVKEEITETVKDVDNGIDNVYVSTNPDFFNLANNYTDDVGNNKPVRGMFDQIGNMIERIFPQNTTN